MLVEMLCRFVPTQADFRHVQPIVCINRSNTPAGLLQSLRNLFSNKAFAAGIDTANPNKDGVFGRSFGPLCVNLGSEEIELIQHRQITAQASSTTRLLPELVNRHLLRLPMPRTREAFPCSVWESKSSRSSDRRLQSSPFSRAATRRSHGVICDRCFHRASRPIRDRFRAVRRSTPKAATAWCPERKWR